MSNKTLSQIIVDLLEEAGGPLHYKQDIYEQIQAKNLYDFGESQAPWQTIRTLLSADKARFEWVAPGKYQLRAGSHEATSSGLPEEGGSLKLAEAAALILQKYSNGVPMHYRDIIELAVAHQLVQKEGGHTWQTLRTLIRETIEAQGEASLFYIEGEHVGLRAWLEGSAAPGPEAQQLTDAVERVLETRAEGKPLHYQRIAELLPEVAPALGAPPAANALLAWVLDDIRYAAQQGMLARFYIQRQEYIGLAVWQAEHERDVVQAYMELAGAWVEAMEMSESGLEASPGDMGAFQKELMALYAKLPEDLRAMYSDPLALFQALKRKQRITTDAGGVEPDEGNKSLSIPAPTVIQPLPQLELRIGISRQMGHYYAVKVDCELGDGWGAVKVSAVGQLKKRAAQVQALFARSQLDRDEEKVAEAFGRALFETFLAPEEIGRLYTLAHFQASEQKRRLRLILNIADAELASLAWELLYDTFHASYLSLRRESSSIIREISRLSRRLPLRVETAPLRILGMIAAPADAEPLQVEQEKAVIEEALARLLDEQRAELHWIEEGSWEALSSAMREGPWHIFHFIGHGGFDAVRQEGYVLFVDEAGNGVPVRAEELGQLLSDNDLRLALLNACESATESGSAPLASTAATLMREGIPAVLAMQHFIADEAAVEFAREFYEALASGYTIEDAVTCARRALTRQAAISIEWGIPALYLRALDSQLLAPA